MSISGAIKTATDSVYAYRFIRLMQKSFVDWNAYELGVIDDKGNLIRRPKTDAEKSAYTPFHASIRSLKRTLGTIPGVTSWQVLASSLSAIGSRYGLTESDWSLISEELDEPMIFEAVVSGDSNGDPVKIASGETSGSVVRGVLKHKRDKVTKF